MLRGHLGDLSVFIPQRERAELRTFSLEVIRRSHTRYIDQPFIRVILFASSFSSM